MAISGPQQFYAPSVDLYVYAPVAQHGLMGWTGRLWSTNGHLAASGGELLCRRLPSATA